MTDLERLTEALRRWEGWELGEPFDAMTLDVLLDAARAYRDLLANGQRVDPDYEAATLELIVWLNQGTLTRPDEAIRPIVDAAFGDRSVYPKEAEK